MSKYKKTFLKIAQVLSENSHCVSHKVGCVIVKNNRIISTGWNGTPAGFLNCDQIFINYDPNISRKEHMEFSDKYEIHGEASALLYAAKEGLAVDGSEAYCTHQPCWNCLKSLIQAGIKEIYFIKKYDRLNGDEYWWEFAYKNNVSIKKVDMEN